MPRRLCAITCGAAVLALSGCSVGGSEERLEPTTERPVAEASGREARPAQRRRDRGVRLVRFGSFDAPLYVTAPPGDRRSVFVVERAGTIRVVRDRRRLSRPFLDISGDVSTDVERGLFSMAFAPDYADSGRFYVYYTDEQGDLRIDELRRAGTSADRADPRSRRSLLRIPHRQFGNHNGGQLQFGPDGMLYAGTGDGGGGGDPLGNGQNLGSLLGKLLRIDPRPAGGRPYRIPAGNPFAGRGGARAEIYAYGLRNPYRFSFDRRTGALTVADQGQDRLEEVNFLRRGRGGGANFGWNRFEGRSRFASGPAPGHVPPVLQRPHSQGYCSITGGYVVRDRALGSLYGRYVYSDLCTGVLRSSRLSPRRARDDRPLGGLKVSSPVSFGEDGRGRVYVTSIEGRVYRLAPR